MCFSATASFTAAAVIGAVGVATLRKATSQSLIWIALIPLLFAFQQFNEGILWLFLGTNHHFIVTTAKYIFLFFALICWPIWIPLAFSIPEKDKERKKGLLILLTIGVILSACNLAFLFLNGAAVSNSEHLIRYDYDSVDFSYVVPFVLLYALVTIGPFFLSRLKFTIVPGILSAIGLIVALYAYENHGTSVWCFFAAVLSIILYKTIKDNKL